MMASDFVSLENVVLDLVAPSKAKVIETIAKKAAATLSIPQNVILDALLRRESLGSTGVGEGIAIPHAPVPGVTKPIGLLAKLAKPIDFEAIDGLPVDVVLVLLTPGDSRKEYLNVLACFARRLRSTEVTMRIRAAKSASDLYAAIAEQT